MSETTACIGCGHPTENTGTKQCDPCWELRRRVVCCSDHALAWALEERKQALGTLQQVGAALRAEEFQAETIASSVKPKGS